MKTHINLTNSTVPLVLVYLKQQQQQQQQQPTILAAGQFILLHLLVIFAENGILTFIITYE
jgi:hypothetical protein